MNMKLQRAALPAIGKPAAGSMNYRDWFNVSAGAILLITGLAKLWSALGDVKVLAVADPITGLPFRWLLLGVGLLELIVAGVCFLNKDKRWGTLLVAWLATSFLVYRLGLWWMDWHRPCGCMGSLTTALHLSERAADNIMKVILAYLLLGSYFLLLQHWRGIRMSASFSPTPISGKG